MEILYCDNHLLVAVKPCNMPSQADSSGDADFLSELKKYIGIKYDKPGNVYLGLVHRLDRPAGGVMVFARTSKAAARLSRQFAVHSQGRRYLAVTRGAWSDEMHPVDYLLKNPDGMVRVVSETTPGAKRAELISRPLETRDGLTLADVELFTGRAHQIRVQHAHLGHPLWGDARYGNGKPGQQLALWAYSLTVLHPTRNEPMTFVAPPPDDGVWRLFRDAIAPRTSDHPVDHSQIP